MRRLCILGTLLAFHATMASAQSQPSPGSEAASLPMAQQIEVGEILTKDAGTPLHGGNFPLSLNSKVPAHIALRPVPDSVNSLAPQFRDHSYVVVDEQIGIVETQSRNIVAILQRWQRPREGAAVPSAR